MKNPQLLDNSIIIEPKDIDRIIVTKGGSIGIYLKWTRRRSTDYIYIHRPRVDFLGTTEISINFYNRLKQYFGL